MLEWGAFIIRFASKIADLRGERMETKDLGTTGEGFVKWHFEFPHVHRRICVHVRVLEGDARVFLIPTRTLASAIPDSHWHIGDVKTPGELNALIPAVLARFPHPPCKAA
ncbi:MAG: hypothetical protein HYT22_03095 [Candidatus Niyogibacteria bacterium]|nr:hypothetical protein [Candidatus Niyogibacteria bacterium]